MNTSFLIPLVKCIIIPICTVMALNHCNIIEYLDFVPKDKVFDIGLMIYLAVSEYIWSFVYNLLTGNKTNIKCVLSVAGQSSSIDTIPVIQFTDDVSIVNVALNIDGPTKKIAKKTVEIPFPSWVDVQVNHKAITLVDKKTCKVDLSKIINTNNKNCTDTNYRFKISLIKNFSEDEQFTDLVVPTINKKFKTTFRSNNLRLK